MILIPMESVDAIVHCNSESGTGIGIGKGAVEVSSAARTCTHKRCAGRKHGSAQSDREKPMQHNPEQTPHRTESDRASEHLHATSFTQYGVKTPNSNVVLMGTTDRSAAQRALEWINDGRVVGHAIHYGPWSDCSESAVDDRDTRPPFEA